MYDEVVHYLVWDFSERCLAISRFPVLPHTVQCLTSAHPLVEGGIDRHVHVCRNGETCRRSHNLGVLTRATEDPTHDFLVFTAAGSVDNARHRRHVRGRQPVDDRSVSLPPGKPKHAFTKGGDQNLRLLLGENPKSKAVDLERVILLLDLLPAKRVV